MDEALLSNRSDLVDRRHFRKGGCDFGWWVRGGQPLTFDLLNFAKPPRVAGYLRSKFDPI
jgi:hypothetical protein